MEKSNQKVFSPFLRWVGGKSWLIKHIAELIKSVEYKNYHEPFLGGGAIFFYLQPSSKVYLSDLNVQLIETYEAISCNYKNVFKELNKFENTEKEYYTIRSRTYSSRWKRAAQFIYLNQTSFNGIYRVNLKGKYNVPYGFRKKEMYNEEYLSLVSKKIQNINFKVCDFELTLNNIKRNDLVFLDPPYTVSHNKNGFIKYNKKLFSLDDQFRLKRMIDEIDNRNAHYILSNAAHELIYKIFKPGANFIELQRPILIGGKCVDRKQISEYIFTNIDIKKK